MVNWLLANRLIAVAGTALVVVGAIVFAIVNSPTVTLAYINALRWPVTAVLLVFVFRQPLAALLARIERGKVPTPFGPAEFETGRRPGAGESPQEAAEEVLERHHELVQEQRRADSSDEQAASDPEQLRARIAELEVAVKLEHALNTLFQAQINFMRWLRNAPEGVTWGAVTQYFSQVQASDPGWTSSNINYFLNYPLEAGFVVITGSGNYRLTTRGQAFLEFTERTFYAAKAH